MALCKENREKISALVDNQLEAAERGALERHLEECEACQRVLQTTRRAKEVMQQTYSRIKAPAHLMRSVRSGIREEARREDARHRVPFFKRLFAPSPVWAVASLVMVLIAGTIYLRTEGIIMPGGEKPTTMGLYLYDIAHDQYLVDSLPNRPLDIESRDADATAAFMTRQIGFEVPVPDLAEAGYTMQGARIWHTVARISALIEYLDESGGRVSLFEIKGERIGKSGGTRVEADGFTFYLGDAFGYNGVVWSQHDVAFGLVSDIPQDKLLEIAKIAARSLTL